MSDEQKAAQEAEEAVEATDEQTSEGKPDEESAQLKAQLEKERKSREEAERKLNETREKARERWEKRRQEEDVEEEDEERPLTAKELASVLAKERETTRKELLASEADRLASRLSEDETSKQLILEIHKNRSFPAHLSLEEQIEECFILANKKKILAENSELKRAYFGKQGTSRDSSTTHQDSLPSNQPKMTSADAAEAARVGFKWNGTNRRFEKKLPNGQTLVYDPKTKRSQLVG